jgi:hypothetical protein
MTALSRQIRTFLRDRLLGRASLRRPLLLIPIRCLILCIGNGILREWLGAAMHILCRVTFLVVWLLLVTLFALIPVQGHVFWQLQIQLLFRFLQRCRDFK